MTPTDFRVFSHLLNEVHRKTFGESILVPCQARSKALSIYIYAATGNSISYKSLYNYSKAVHLGEDGSVNPSESTLGILVHYISETGNTHTPLPLYMHWYQFRKDRLCKEQARVSGLETV